MTRISTQPRNDNQKPDTIRLGELAIAAGFTGKPIALCFSESAAAVDCELWKYYARFADPSRVLHVHRQADVNTLKKGMRLWRLVIVHSERLYHEVAWKVQSHALDTVSRPAVLSRAVADALEDVPIPAIAIRGNEDESARIVGWVLSSSSQPQVLPGELPTSLDIDPALVPVVTPCDLPNGRGPRRFDHCRVIAALLSGAALLRSIHQPDAHGAIAGQTEYALVRRLLQSPLVHSAQDTVDTLAVEMVNRANVYVEVKMASDYWDQNPLRVQGNDPILKLSGSRTNKVLVTRKEIADLGNIRSRLVHDVLAFLQRIPDGYEKFARMGLARQPPSKPAWSKARPDKLPVLLRSWSAKQVRTHFDRLHKAGVILGQRDQANGPWRYDLPEELTTVNVPFRSLPSALDLFPGTDANAET